MAVFPSYVAEARARQRRRWIAGAVAAALLALLGALALVVLDAPVADASIGIGGVSARCELRPDGFDALAVGAQVTAPNARG